MASLFYNWLHFLAVTSRFWCALQVRPSTCDILCCWWQCAAVSSTIWLSRVNVCLSVHVELPLIQNSVMKVCYCVVWVKFGRVDWKQSLLVCRYLHFAGIVLFDDFSYSYISQMVHMFSAECRAKVGTFFVWMSFFCSLLVGMYGMSMSGWC